MHVPPCRQGSLAHSSVSESKIMNTKTNTLDSWICGWESLGWVPGYIGGDMWVILVQSKREFTLSAISNHQYSSKRFTIYPFQTAQSNNISASLGSIHYDAIDARRLFVHNNPPLCITCYSFMQLIDLRHRRVKQHAQNVHSSLNPGYEPGFA